MTKIDEILELLHELVNQRQIIMHNHEIIIHNQEAIIGLQETISRHTAALESMVVSSVTTKGLVHDLRETLKNS